MKNYFLLIYLIIILGRIHDAYKANIKLLKIITIGMKEKWLRNIPPAQILKMGKPYCPKALSLKERITGTTFLD